MDNTVESETKWISGFWRRIGALVLDSFVLGLIGFLLSLFFANTFVEMGGWGRLVGFSISLLYFGVMNSKVCGGQTLGKKVLKIKVVTAENYTISLRRSILRYCVLAIPFSLNGAPISNEINMSAWGYVISIVLFGGLLSTCYLYLFNRNTRQSLHDLAAKTFVVNASAEPQSLTPIWRVHLGIVAVLLVLSAAAPLAGEKLVNNVAAFQELLSVQAALQSDPSVAYASVYDNFSVSSQKSTTAWIEVAAVLKNNGVHEADFAQDLALLVIQNYSAAVDRDFIQITLTFGYDIGIWSSWASRTYPFDPSELPVEASI